MLKSMNSVKLFLFVLIYMTDHNQPYQTTTTIMVTDCFFFSWMVLDTGFLSLSCRLKKLDGFWFSLDGGLLKKRTNGNDILIHPLTWFSNHLCLRHVTFNLTDVTLITKKIDLFLTKKKSNKKRTIIINPVSLSPPGVYLYYPWKIYYPCSRIEYSCAVQSIIPT